MIGGWRPLCAARLLLRHVAGALGAHRGADLLGQALGIGAFATANPRLTSVQIFGMVNWAWTWFDPHGSLTAVEIADQFSRTVIGGLAPGETREGTDSERLAASVSEAMRAHRPPAS